MESLSRTYFYSRPLLHIGILCNENYYLPVSIDSKLVSQLKKVLLVILVFGLVVTIIGAVLVFVEPASVDLCPNTKPSIPGDYTVILDYTNCIEEFTYDTSKQRKCIDVLREYNNSISCTCLVNFTLNYDFIGNTVVYYEIDFNQSSLVKENHFFTSRDDAQLNGVLSEHPSETCEPYAYDLDENGVKRPIAPCGAIADAMFNDTFEIICSDGNSLPIDTTGIIKQRDKIGYRNPPLEEDMTLKDTFEMFTKPKNWKLHIWELSLNLDVNNGFESEEFIGWMKTDWVRKPVWRVNRKEMNYKIGLKKGDYLLRIGYYYPLSRYNGTRKVVISSCNVLADCETSTGFMVGLTCVASGFVLILLAGLAYYRLKQSNAGGIRFHNENMRLSPMD